MMMNNALRQNELNGIMHSEMKITEKGMKMISRWPFYIFFGPYSRSPRNFATTQIFVR
jgi:hypothetical protein